MGIESNGFQSDDDIGPAARMALGPDGEYRRGAARMHWRANQVLRTENARLRHWNIGLLGCVALSGCLLIAAGVFL